MNKKHKTMSYLEYFLRQVYVASWLCFIYYTVLFIHIPNLSVNASKAIFFIGNQVIWIVLSLITPAKIRSKYNSFFNVMLAYIPYFLLTYSPIYKKFTNAFIIIAVILSVMYFCTVLFKKVKHKQNFKRVIKRRTQFALNGVRSIAGVLACILLVSACFCSVFGINLIQSDVPILKSANVGGSEQWSIKNNLDTVKFLQESEWKNLSVSEKMDILAVVRNIEVQYLGIPHEVYVAIKTTNDGILGYYDHKEHTIVIDHELISSDDVKETLHTLCHEMYHAYQYNQIEAYKSVDEEYKNMLMFSNARAYEEEFQNYISGEDDFWGYILQDSEIMADKYAQEAVEDYYRKIEVYLNEEKQTKAV